MRIFQRIFPMISKKGFVLTAFLFTAVILSQPVLAKMEQYPGVVVKLDLGNSYVVVMNPQTGGRLRFSLTEKTAVTDKENLKEITDLVPGAPVVVEYEQSGDRYIARHISIQPASE